MSSISNESKGSRQHSGIATSVGKPCHDNLSSNTAPIYPKTWLLDPLAAVFQPGEVKYLSPCGRLLNFPSESSA